ncbi:MAG TPA: glycosyltransferase family 39 protein [Chthoniobacterales bacterium]|nr:glycosyltransferase family 39 protein [Chthoniobacterales bacterium]
MNFSALSRHGAFVVLLLFYGAILALQFDHGLASGDGHGIVRATQALLNGGQLDVSRPPGHPTTEFYLFGATGWISEKVFGVEFDDKVYLVCQAAGALATLIIFYSVLCHLGAARARALLAAICLAYSTQFLFNAVDGEEFDFGLLFLLVAVWLLVVRPGTPNFSRLWLSIFSFALATGCRPELVFAAIIFPIYCMLNPELGRKYALLSVALTAIAVVIVWLPILFMGIRAPYTAGMNLRESILGGVYRIIFQAFTPPVFLLLCWVLITAVRDLRKQMESKNFVFTMSCVVPLIFLAVFFLHPSKAAHLLVTLPFLLLLAVDRSLALVLALTFFTLLGAVANIDIFKDRQLARPFFVSGSYFQAVLQKPYYRLDYLRKLFDQCQDRPAVIIGNAWPWDFEYHIERANLPLCEKDLHAEIKRDIPAFFSSGDHCIFLPPDAAYEGALLSEWQRKGYAMKMDAKLYRTLFARYDVHSAISSATADVCGVSFALFRIE